MEEKSISLYQITSAFPALMENEEITEENKEKIQEELTLLLQKKSTNIIGYVRNLELTIEAMKNEEKRISTNRKNLENRLENFKTYVKNCMDFNDISKVETNIGTLNICKSPNSVTILNEDEIPDEFKIIETTVKIDKNKILDNFKSTGEIPEGININTENTYLKIK